MDQNQINQFTTNLIIENKRMRNFPSLSEIFIAEPKKVSGLIFLLNEENKYPFPEYSSWLITHIARKKKEILLPYYKDLIDHLLKVNSQSVRRNLLGAINCFSLNEYEESALLDKLILWISNPISKPAVIMYSIEKLEQFCIKYPEIRIEIEAILNLKDNNEIGPAVKVAKRKFLYGK
jgi:hypothetical protein